jgi:hypothetical protein
MRTMHDNAEALIESEGERALPPGGGLLIAIAVSMTFWAALAWAVM